MVFDLKGMLQAFLDHRFEVIIRRSRFELAQAEARAHILEGLREGAGQLDAVITLIRRSADAGGGPGRACMSDVRPVRAEQAERDPGDAAAAADRSRAEEDRGGVRRRSRRGSPSCRRSSASRERVLGLIRQDLLALARALRRRAAHRDLPLEEGLSTFDLEDLIPEEDMVITITHSGYIKRVAATSYRSQRRGGRGLTRSRRPRKRTSSSTSSSPRPTAISCSSPTGGGPTGSRSTRSRSGRGRRAGRSILNLISAREGRADHGLRAGAGVRRGPLPGAGHAPGA